MFTSVGPRDWNDLLDYMDTVITPEMNEALVRPFEESQIKKAAFQIGGSKSLQLNA